jgi:hypothetical protein
LLHLQAALETPGRLFCAPKAPIVAARARRSTKRLIGLQKYSCLQGSNLNCIAPPGAEDGLQLPNPMRGRGFDV